MGGAPPAEAVRNGSLRGFLIRPAEDSLLAQRATIRTRWRER